MNNFTKISFIFTSTFLSACVNQNTLAQKKIAPVTNACTKISQLIKAYDSNFDQIKLNEVKSRSTTTWKAKYNIIGENCHIWSLGTKKLTYSCNISTDNEETAESYYHKAKQTIQQCLGEKWQMNEEARNNNTGRKTTFTTPEQSVSLSAHIVPDNGLFSEKWTIYYYIGNPR